MYDLKLNPNEIAKISEFLTKFRPVQLPITLDDEAPWNLNLGSVVICGLSFSYVAGGKFKRLLDTVWKMNKQIFSFLLRAFCTLLAFSAPWKTDTPNCTTDNRIAAIISQPMFFVWWKSVDPQYGLRKNSFWAKVLYMWIIKGVVWISVRMARRISSQKSLLSFFCALLFQRYLQKFLVIFGEMVPTKFHIM